MPNTNTPLGWKSVAYMDSSQAPVLVAMHFSARRIRSVQSRHVQRPLRYIVDWNAQGMTSTPMSRFL